MKPSNLKTEHIVILIAIAVKLVLQFIATANSGYHGDEVLHIEAGKHLAFGYMDFPPFIGFISWIQNLFHSDSLYVNHFFNYLNSVLIILFCGLIAIRLGGGVLAVLLTESAILFSPGLGASQYLFLPTAFEQLFWVLIIYCLIRFITSQNKKYLVFISLLAAPGFLNKYSIVFLLLGIVVSVLLFKRELLTQRFTWFSVLLFIVLISPNIFWQFANNFPVLNHLSELYETQLNQQSFLKAFTTLIISLNPLSLIIWLPAILIVPFLPKFKDQKVVTFALLFSCILLFFSKGKFYYFFPVLLSSMAIGAVFIENLLQKRKWLGYAYIFFMVSFGIYLLPHGLPLLKLERYICLYSLTPNDDNKIPLSFENYYANGNWQRILKSVSYTYLLPRPHNASVPH